MIRRAYECVEKDHACAAGMPVKDTIKIVDEEGFVRQTPVRSSVWLVQTPQVFDTELVKKAYAVLMEEEENPAQKRTGGESRPAVTDDAMVVEQMLGRPVRLFLGAYENIKITTPEDLETAEVFLKRKC